MRKICLAILSFICSYMATAQTPYYDALTLSRYIENGKFITGNEEAVKVYCAILNNYLLHPLPQTNLRTVATAYRNTASEDYNPFLRNFFSTDLGVAAANNPINAAFTGIASSIGGLNVTNFADGLAKFMVKRFKEELNLAFFQKLKEEINGIEELRILFPETNKLLQVIDKEIYRYNVYIITLREAFIKDLSAIYGHLNQLLELSTYRNILDNNPVLKTILKTSLYLIDQLSKGAHAGDILAGFPLSYLDFNNDALTLNTRGAIHTTQILSASLRSKSPDRFWISTDSLALLFKDADTVTFRIYLGLIYQTAKKENVRFQDDKTLTQILDMLAVHLDSLSGYRRFVESFGDKAEEVNEYITELKGKKKSDINYDDYYKLFNASLDLIQHSFTFIDLPYVGLVINASTKETIKAKSGHLLFVARTAGEVFVDSRTKNYSSAILNTVVILDTLFENSTRTVREKVLKYGTFMAAVASAENSDDVATVIEAVALPVGGSAIKKHSNFNIAIQAYLGGSYGRETIKELKTNQTKDVASIFAPVGVSLSWGVMRKWKNPFSAGIHVNLLDIGALASFRFNDTTTAINSDIQLKNIFAPGVYFAVGLPKWPVSIGYGLQAGPQLRKIKDGTPDIETEKIYTRSSFFIAVDIPLFNLYNKSE